MEKTEEILNARGNTYGDFTMWCHLTQSLEQTCIGHMRTHNPEAIRRMHPVMAEGLHMILAKIARVINGDPCHEDSWRDISGYAKLVADRVPEIVAHEIVAHESLMANMMAAPMPAEVAEDAHLATRDQEVPVGGVHPHEEEPRRDFPASSETVVDPPIFE